MKVFTELNLTNFEFWSEAKNHKFSYNELKDLEFHFDELYSDGMSETQVNDIFWFEEKFLCELLDIDFDEYLER